jgi:hypothetical protein
MWFSSDRQRIDETHYLSVYLSVYLSIYLCIYLSFYLSIHLSIYLSIYLWLYFVGPRPLFQFLDLFIQSVGLLGLVISPSQGLHTKQHKHGINAHRHPCLKWDSNPQSQCLSRRRKFMPQTAGPL